MKYHNFWFNVLIYYFVSQQPGFRTLFSDNNDLYIYLAAQRATSVYQRYLLGFVCRNSQPVNDVIVIKPHIRGLKSKLERVQSDFPSHVFLKFNFDLHSSKCEIHFVLSTAYINDVTAANLIFRSFFFIFTNPFFYYIQFSFLR